jgi:hypothetical protein
MKLAITLVTSSLAFGQLTPEQKQADFLQLAGLYAKYYGPYEWKREAVNFDLYDVAPWLDRVRATRSDLEFYDVCIDYVAALKDTHDTFQITSSFSASLGFTVDLYDGRLLVDSINRSLLPLRDYPIQIGDELLSIDGRPAMQLLDQEFLRYSTSRANPSALRRRAAQLLTSRPQALIPRAHQVGESADVVVRNAAGEERTYTIKWDKFGLAIDAAGPVPSPKTDRAAFGFSQPIPVPPGEPEYMRPLMALTHAGAFPQAGDAVLGVGNLAPVFDPPPGFQVRQGIRPTDNFLSGTFRAGGRNLGYIRIPRMTSTSTLAQAYREFETEIAFFQQNTDGLVVDIMRNPGGNIGYGHELARRLIPEPFEGVGFELRANAGYVANFSATVETARRLGAPDHVVRSYEALLHDLFETFKQNRGRTGALPLGHDTVFFQPATDETGRNIAYTKPLIVLIDEFSCSTADLFAAVLQDAGRGPLVGMRTAGCGGTNTNFPATTYSEGLTGMTLGIMVRPKPVATPEFPTTRYIENAGVRPDIELDYMTRDNLMQRGRPFVDAITQIILDRIAAAQ